MRKRIRKRLLKIIDECEQFIHDIVWWNNNRTDAEPMDCEPERIMAEKARRCLTAFDAGDREGYMRLSRELAEYAETLALELDEP